MDLRGWGLAILAAVVYTAGMAVNWAVTPYEYGGKEMPQLAAASIPMLVVLVLLMLLLIRLSGLQVQGRGRPWNWVAVTGTIIILAGSSQMLVSMLGGVDGVDWRLVGALVVACVLIGFGEELAYRGLVLGGLAQVVSVPVAVVVSSVFFALLHSINYFAGQSASQTLFQLFYTFLIGLALGWVYIGSGRNLVLVALLHGVWDLHGLVTPLMPHGTYYSFIALVALWVLGIVATIVGWRRYRSVPLTEIG